MGSRVRHHVNPLKLGHVRTTPKPLPEHLPFRAFRDRPIEVELGCADARFLFERARMHPEILCVGVEIRKPLVAEVNDKARKEGLANLVAIYANINGDLEELFVPGQVTRFYLNFPDPWFKRSQQKRRVVQAELAEVLTKLLHPAGEVFFQSDVWDLALSAMEVLEQTKGLQNRRGEWSFEKQNQYGAQSLREVRVEEKGLPVWRMCYQKVPGFSDSGSNLLAGETDKGIHGTP